MDSLKQKYVDLGIKEELIHVTKYPSVVLWSKTKNVLLVKMVFQMVKLCQKITKTDLHLKIIYILV